MPRVSIVGSGFGALTAISSLRQLKWETQPGGSTTFLPGSHAPVSITR